MADTDKHPIVVEFDVYLIPRSNGRRPMPPEGAEHIGIVTVDLDKTRAGQIAVERAMELMATRTPDVIDDEVFCPYCHAGMESSEHHTKCVLRRVTGDPQA